MPKVKAAKRPAAAKKIDANEKGHGMATSLQEMDCVKADGSRNEELDRVSTLAWIARDLAEELMINTRK
jgi:hypothetical protein